MLYFIGLGLGNEKDISVLGLEIVQKCHRVYLEDYTSILGISTKKLEEFYKRKVILADRLMVEENEKEILEHAETQDVAFLVVGDPFAATTHSSLWIKAKERNLSIKIIHNASILSAVGCTGLQLYRFGQTVSIVFFNESWQPDSFYDKIKANLSIGLHTLCLLDIKVKEQSTENLMRGKLIFESPRYMTIFQCIHQLLEIEHRRNENIYNESTLCVGVSRIQQEDQIIYVGSMLELLEVDFGSPLHSLIIPGSLQVQELEHLMFYATDQTKTVLKNLIHRQCSNRK